MHEIKVWRKKQRTKRFGKSLGLRHGNRIKDENNLFTLKKKQVHSKRMIFPRKARNTSETPINKFINHQYLRLPETTQERKIPWIPGR
jgi:hypothetical protein